MKFRGIFWKIFLAFWLANLFVVAATSYLVYSSLEASSVKEKHRSVIDNLVITIANRYEAERHFSKREYTNLLDQMPMYKRTAEPLRFRLLDENNNIVFRNRFPKKDARKIANDVITFTVTSDSGREYTVESFVKAPPKYIFDRLQRINFIQYFFVLISSAAVSFLLSWHFARPLKSLSAYSQRYASGDSKTKIENKLLGRFDEIGDLARDLSYMGGEVERNISNQKQLLHDVSHELRAPLARLQALAGLLELHVGQESKEVIRIHKECARIDDLIQQILNLSRAEKLEAQNTERDLVVFIREQIEAVSIEYTGRKIDFMPKTERCVLLVNEYALDAALHNVLVNACKYTDEDTAIKVSLNTQADTVTIVVHDNGKGVDEKDLAQLLTPFYRGGNKMHSEGFGLGLSIAQRALRASGGDIRLRNHPEGGLEVTLSFVKS